MTDNTVLVVSTKQDVATDVVCNALAERDVRFVRLNTEDYPFDTTITHRTTSGLSVRVGEQHEERIAPTSSVWYRRYRSPERPAAMDPGVYEFCLREARATLLGSLLNNFARVMSPPERIWCAEHKLFQLGAAHRCGLQIPDTLVTNDPNEVRRSFHRYRGRMIVKAVRSGYAEIANQHYAVFTSQVLESHLDTIADARWGPAIYQPLLQRKSDVRVTVVGQRLFVAEIETQSESDTMVDWRRVSPSELKHCQASLPPVIERSVHRFMSQLGLLFGALDLIRTHDDSYIFLEVNPNGQWVWLDDILELGISAAVAEWLIGNAA